VLPSPPTPATTRPAPHTDRAETVAWEGDVFSITNRYRVLRSHARGGLGEVYLAKDEALDRRVALKQMQDQWAGDEQSRARFLVEAEITGGLDHPFAVPIHGLGFDRANRPFYAMRFVDGQTLKGAADEFHGSLKHSRLIGPPL